MKTIHGMKIQLFGTEKTHIHVATKPTSAQCTEPKYSDSPVSACRGFDLSLVCQCVCVCGGNIRDCIICLLVFLCCFCFLVRSGLLAFFQHSFSVRSLKTLASRTPMKRISQSSKQITNQPSQRTREPNQPNNPPKSQSSGQSQCQC